MIFLLRSSVDTMYVCLFNHDILFTRNPPVCSSLDFVG
uniref:Uncharacterized protein n=1 Tax=Arabidopsis thaliana TaxID=3702 RepID=Q0WSK7_ARATH|nr:hypothetical protein [Arabidopsis thaliana]